MSARNIFAAAAGIQADVRSIIGPPDEGRQSRTQQVLPLSIVRNTRAYIERIVIQVNGCYENGWYDGCAVMLRRLLETLIIEAFEKHNIAAKIKNPQGDFRYLGDLIDACLGETTWNLGRNSKHAMPSLKDIGDKSAHSRRYLAHRGDIDPKLADIRAVVQELVHLAGLK